MTTWLEERPATARTRPNVRIPMRDGVELSADLFYPESDDPAPVIIKYYPYRKDDMLRALTVDRANYYAAHGYITALLDVRGTGASAGVCDRMLRLEEWEDGYDAVEWLAAQPWCTGAVAMTGVSYGGFSALLTAAQAPPSLKAIAPIYAGWDCYENSHQGGMWQTSIWSGAYNAMMIALSGAPPAADPEGAWLEIWEEHLAHKQALARYLAAEPGRRSDMARGFGSLRAREYTGGHLHHRRLARHLRLRPVLHVHGLASGRTQEADDGSLPAHRSQYRGSG